jgi:hypothetical protein
MRLGWMALPWLMAVTACSTVQDYQAAARSLRFTLDRVEPSLELAFPLDQSRVTFQITLGVDNPSAVPFHLRSFEGALRLGTAGLPQPLGRITLVRALDLPAGGKAQLTVALALGYRELADRWPEIQAALHGEASGAWELDGTLGGTVYGFPVQVPVRTRQTFGAAP